MFLQAIASPHLDDLLANLLLRGIRRVEPYRRMEPVHDAVNLQRRGRIYSLQKRRCPSAQLRSWPGTETHTPDPPESFILGSRFKYLDVEAMAYAVSGRGYPGQASPDDSDPFFGQPAKTRG